MGVIFCLHHSATVAVHSMSEGMGRGMHRQAGYTYAYASVAVQCCVKGMNPPSHIYVGCICFYVLHVFGVWHSHSGNKQHACVLAVWQGWVLPWEL